MFIDHPMKMRMRVDGGTMMVGGCPRIVGRVAAARGVGPALATVLDPGRDMALLSGQHPVKALLRLIDPDAVYKTYPGNLTHFSPARPHDRPAGREPFRHVAFPLRGHFPRKSVSAFAWLGC